MRGIAASWVVTGDVGDAPIARGAVVLGDDQRVLAVGESEALHARYPQAQWESVRAVLMPGLVNAHAHLELSALRGQVPGGRGFVPWLSAQLAAREKSAPEQDIEALDRAVSELLAFGTAAVAEVTNTLAAVPYLGVAPILACVFHEVYAMRHDTGLAMLELASQRKAEADPWPRNASYTLAPHTPYSLHPEILREIVRRARAGGKRTTLHLCEHVAERAFLTSGGGPFAQLLADRGSSELDWTAPGLDPVRYAMQLGVLSTDVLCVHLTDARPDEIALVASSKAKVVLCPRSNLHIEVKLPPLTAMLEAGLRPALGTDSLASNQSLDVLDEAKALAERFPSVPARTLLAMTTSYGAAVLGLEDRVGRIAEGLGPGLIAFGHGASVPEDPERFVLSKHARERRVLARPALTEAA